MLRLIKPAIAKAVRAQKRAEYEQALDQAWEAHVDQGGGEDNWETPFEFDDETAEEAADDLVARATSRDPQVQAAAYTEISELCLSPLELLSEAHWGTLSDGFQPDESPEYHDVKIRELERRRREVKRDYDLLQQSRSQDDVIIEQ